MNGIGSNEAIVSSIQGQLLRIGNQHEVAIYTRGGLPWAAEFVAGHGELMDATTWFRFHCGIFTISHAWRRMALQTALPLSEEMVAMIETLHRRAESFQGGVAAPRVASARTRGAFRGLGRLIAKIFGRQTARQSVRLGSGART